MSHTYTLFCFTRCAFWFWLISIYQHVWNAINTTLTHYRTLKHSATHIWNSNRGQINEILELFSWRTHIHICIYTHVYQWEYWWFLLFDVCMYVFVCEYCRYSHALGFVLGLYTNLPIIEQIITTFNCYHYHHFLYQSISISTYINI